MDKALGRDNAMYNISEINNLNDKEENAFAAYLSMNSVNDNEVKKPANNSPLVSSSTITP